MPGRQPKKNESPKWFFLTTELFTIPFTYPRDLCQGKNFQRFDMDLTIESNSFQNAFQQHTGLDPLALGRLNLFQAFFSSCDRHHGVSPGHACAKLQNSVNCIPRSRKLI